MKRLLLVLLFALLLSTVACYSATITLQWDLSSDDALLGATGGYCLLQSNVSQNYGTVCAASVLRGVNTVSVTVPKGVYYWVVIAKDDQGNKSDYSNEVTATVKPGKPNNLKIP